MIRAAYIVGCGLVLAGVAGSPLLLNIETDNSLERWVDSDAETTRQYEEFITRFGNDEIIVAAISGESLLSEASLDHLVSALEGLESIPQVVRVSGIPTVYRDQFGLEDADMLAREVTTTPYYKRLYLSDDGRVAGLLIETEPGPDAAARANLVAAVSKMLAPLRAQGFGVRLVGPPVLNVELDSLSSQEAQRTFPFAIIASVLVLAALLRSPGAVSAAVLSSTLTLGLALEVLALSRYSLNMVTMTLPPLLWVLSLSNAIHLVRRYSVHANNGTPKPTAIERAVSETLFPNALSSLTTALGFLSLTLADMAPVREMGTMTATGLVIGLLVNVTVTPLLLRIAPRSRARSVERDKRTSRSLRYPKRTLAASGVLIAVTACGILAVRVESNPLAFFPDTSVVREDYEAVCSELAGAYSLEIVLQLPGPWTDPKHWGVIEDLAAQLRSSPVAARVVTPLDVLRLLNQWDNDFDSTYYTLPKTQAEAESLVEELDESDRRMLERLVQDDGATVRLSAMITEMNSGPFLACVDQVDDALRGLPPGYSGYSTGMVLRLVRAQDALVATQLKSFGLAFLTIFACILIGLRSVRLTLISVIPNLAPIAVVLGLMGYLGVRLDAGTVMVASVALGIAVDDTIHLLCAIAKERAREEDWRTVIRNALPHVAPAMIITTLTTAVGFLTLTQSAFVPIRYFGLLVGVAIGIALLADLYLVPALLLAANTDKDG